MLQYITNKKKKKTNDSKKTKKFLYIRIEIIKSLNCLSSLIDKKMNKNRINFEKVAHFYAKNCFFSVKKTKYLVYL